MAIDFDKWVKTANFRFFGCSHETAVKELRQFAAEVIRDMAAHYGMLIDHSRPPEDVMAVLKRRAAEIEAGR